jgi:hypothetical protein
MGLERLSGSVGRIDRGWETDAERFISKTCPTVSAMERPAARRCLEEGDSE